MEMKTLKMKATRGIAVAIAALALALQTTAAFATPINLNTGISLSVNPDSTGTATLSATNFDNGTSVTNWNAWAAAVQLRPEPGAVGTMTLTAILLPATNGSLANPDSGTFDPNGVLSGTISLNGTQAYTAIGFSSNDETVTLWAPGQTYNLARLEVTASADAQGTWTLYAVNQGSTITNWFDDTGNPTAFGNTPAAPAGTSLTLGTVIAVPEPGSLSLALAAGGVGLLGGLRRRQSRVGTKA